jgi:HSP20 family protein
VAGDASVVPPHEETIYVPGFRKEDFTIEVSDDNILSVNAEMENELLEKDRFGLMFTEMNNSFNQSFQLSEDADMEHIEASYKNDRLTVLVTKKSGIPLSDELI